MESTGELNPCKPHYDISMSKRTRKPMLDLKETQKDLLTQSEDEDCRPNVLDEHRDKRGDAEHKSLKQLIGRNEEASNGVNVSKLSRSSLGQHFTEEKQLQLVTKQKQGAEGLKRKGMVSHCVRALSHFIKFRHVHSRSNIGSMKKPLLRSG